MQTKWRDHRAELKHQEQRLEHSIEMREKIKAADADGNGAISKGSRCWSR